jgi:CIC family chloride channel protein
MSLGYRLKNRLRHLGDGEDRSRGLYSALSGWSTRVFQRAMTTEHLIMIVLAILIGTLGGLGAVGVRALIREISNACYPGEHTTLLENIAAAPWYYKLLIPTIGGLIVGPIIHRFAQEAKGTGVPEVMHSVLMRGGRIRPRVALLKTLVSTVTIGTGGSVGREGPIVQIGASLGSTISQFFQIPAKRTKTLVGCGAAAGIAAAFNAPIAGAMFAVEIILMDYAVASFSPIVISSVMATVISHAFEGDFPAMEVIGHHGLHSFWEIDFYLIFAILCGVVAWLFIKILYSITDYWEQRVRIASYIKPMIGGALIGIIALFFPQIMGVGYDSVNLALNHEAMGYMGLGETWVNGLLGNQAFWIMVLVLVFVKILATSITLGSGGSGGIFAPSLFIGAMLGGFFGHFAHTLFPDLTASAGTYALIGMGGIVAGTTRAPITAIITIFELTKETSIILPLMLVCIISTIVCSKFTRESIYTLKLLRRNVSVRDHAEQNIIKGLYVRDLYDRDFVSVPRDADFGTVVATMIDNGLSFIAVRNDRTGEMIGIIRLSTIRSMLTEGDALRYVCIAADIADKSVGFALPEDNCGSVLKKLRHYHMEGLPVVDSVSMHRQIGVIWLNDIVDAYEQELEHRDMTSDLAHKLSIPKLRHDVRFLEGYAIAEMNAPKAFIGRSIGQLGIRQKHGVDILTIKVHSEYGTQVKAIPQSDYVFNAQDILVVAGREEDVVKLKNLP